MLASLRDALQKIISNSDQSSADGQHELLQRLDKLLYHDTLKYQANLTIVDCEDFCQYFCRLLPSYCDRRSFYHLITNSNTQPLKASIDFTFQENAKNIFDELISKKLKEYEPQSVERHIELLTNWTDMAITKMGIMCVEIVSDIDMPQVFLWLQEKTLCGDGALLYNPTPGRGFTAADLARNYLMACSMNESMEAQEDFYRNTWLNGVEVNFHKVKDLDEALNQFILNYPRTAVHISSYERKVTDMLNSPMGQKLKSMGQNPSSLILYAKFISLYEQMARDRSNIALNAVKKLAKIPADQQMMLPPSSEKLKQSDSDFTIDQNLRIVVTKLFIDQFKQFITTRNIKEIQ